MEQLAISKLTKCNKDQINYPIKSFTVGKQAKGGLDDVWSVAIVCSPALRSAGGH